MTTSNNSMVNRRMSRTASYVSRPSSGRPGSPHRYFGGSYDVAVEELLTGEGDDARKSDGLSPNFDTADVNKPTTLARIGRQVVHRHRNGLCIVTAGDVLEQMIISGIDETTERNKDNIEESTSLPPCGGDNPLSITALHFHVEVGKDSKSAKGKIRSRNKNPMKKRKRPGNTLVMNVGEVESVTDNTHDGNVLPHDPLCTISLSDGRQVQLYCCVGGTVIEINNNLLPPSLNNGDIDDDSVDAGGGVINNTYSVLLTNPLLDGYLAVIMPGRKGDFTPPQCR